MVCILPILTHNKMLGVLMCANITGYTYNLILDGMQTDNTSITFSLRIWQDVWYPQLYLSMAQDPARDSKTI